MEIHYSFSPSRFRAVIVGREILTDKIPYGDATTMTNMTKGIRVIGREKGGAIIEEEYFYGLDVDQLNGIRKFAQNLTRTQAVWPQRNGRCVEYNVARARCDPNLPDEVRLEVTYKQEQNPEIVRIFREEDRPHDHLWGTNIFVFRPGCKSGKCEWVAKGNSVRARRPSHGDPWESFDLGEGRARRPSTTTRKRREAPFRDMILECDNHRCVLTGETTNQALDAAHLIAANGDNDLSQNGITLRADLHRLFDAGLFTFDTDGRVVKIDSGLSSHYHELLQDSCLPPETLNRVGAILALRQFRNHPPAR